MPQLLHSKQLREERASLVEANSKLLDQLAEIADEARKTELEKEWDKRDADVVRLTAAIDRAERQETHERDLERPLHERRSGRTPPVPSSEDEEREHAERYKRIFWRSLAIPPWELPPEDRAILQRGYRKLEGPFADVDGGGGGIERRDGLVAGTPGAGGYTVPQGFFAELQQNMLAYGGVRPFARILTTGSGNTLPIPTVDDTSNEAAIVSEGGSLTSPQDPTFGQISLTAYMYRSLVLVSLELLQDSAFDLETFIRGIIEERFARGTNRHFTTGNGTTQPDGFITNASSGYTAAASNAIAYNDLVELEHSIDPAYRSQGCTWQMHDSTLKLVKELKDSQGRPLWLPGLAVREPDTILGYRYGINQHMASAEASAKTIAFGNFQKFLIRDVSTMLIIRANELHIANGMIGFYAFSRHDSDTLDAGTDPIKYLTMPSP